GIAQLGVTQNVDGIEDPSAGMRGRDFCDQPAIGRLPRGHARPGNPARCAGMAAEEPQRSNVDTGFRSKIKLRYVDEEDHPLSGMFELRHGGSEAASKSLRFR